MGKKRKASADESLSDQDATQAVTSPKSRTSKKPKTSSQVSPLQTQRPNETAKLTKIRKKTKILTAEEKAYRDDTPAERKARKNQTGIDDSMRLRMAWLFPEERYLKKESPKPDPVETSTSSSASSSEDESDSGGGASSSVESSSKAVRVPIESTMSTASTKWKKINDAAILVSDRSAAIDSMLECRIPKVEFKPQTHLTGESIAGTNGLQEFRVLTFKQQYIQHLLNKNNKKLRRIATYDRKRVRIVFTNATEYDGLVHCEISGRIKSLGPAMRSILRSAEARRLRHQAATNKRMELLLALSMSQSPSARLDIQHKIRMQERILVQYLHADSSIPSYICASGVEATVDSIEASVSAQQPIHQVQGARPRVSSDVPSYPESPSSAIPATSKSSKARDQTASETTPKASTAPSGGMSSTRQPRNIRAHGFHSQSSSRSSETVEKMQPDTSNETNINRLPTQYPSSSTTSFIPKGATVIKIEDDDDDLLFSSAAPDIAARQLDQQELEAIFTAKNAEIKRLKRENWMQQFILEYEGISEMQVERIMKKCNNPRNGTWDSNCLAVLAHGRKATK